jgi:hypothetical protein
VTERLAVLRAARWRRRVPTPPLWRWGGDWPSGVAADALARSWGFDLAPLDEWSGYPDAGGENCPP